MVDSVKSARQLGLLVIGCAVVLGLSGCESSTAQEQAAAQRLKDAGAIVLSQNDAVYLVNLARKPLTDELAADIGDLFNLKNLDLTGVALTDDQLKIALPPLNPVSVVLSETAVTDAGLEALSGSKRIEAIFLRNTGIGDQGLKYVGGLKSLLEIDLTNTNVTNEGLIQLAGLSNLKRLILEGTSVDDAGLQNLKPLKSLGRISLRDTGVTVQGVSDLGKAIPGLMVDQ